MSGNFYMLAHVKVHLGVLDERLVLIVRILMPVFLQMYKGFLQMRYEKMIGFGFFA